MENERQIMITQGHECFSLNPTIKTVRECSLERSKSYQFTQLDAVQQRCVLQAGCLWKSKLDDSLFFELISD